MSNTKANTRKVLADIAADMARDAKEFDGKPLTGRVLAEYMGNHGAAIAALAGIVADLLPEDTEPAPVPEREANVWAKLMPLLVDERTAPVDVTVHSSSISIRLRSNDRAAVDATYAGLGVDEHPALRLGHFWNPGKDGEYGEFVVYGAYGWDSELRSPPLPGYTLNVYCHLHTQADASLHWDGLILHSAMAVA